MERVEDVEEESDGVCSPKLLLDFELAYSTVLEVFLIRAHSIDAELFKHVQVMRELRILEAYLAPAMEQLGPRHDSGSTEGTHRQTTHRDLALIAVRLLLSIAHLHRSQSLFAKLPAQGSEMGEERLRDLLLVLMIIVSALDKGASKDYGGRLVPLVARTLRDVDAKFLG